MHDILTAASSGNLSQLFEFGHVLWRPLGYVIFRVLTWTGPAASPRVLANVALLIPSFVGGVVCAVLFFRIALMISRSRWIAFLTSVALVCTNSFLDYSESGSSYVAGLALFTLSVWIALGAPDILRIAAAACALAGSILLWFPFVTVAPGVLAIVLFWTGAARARRAIELTVITAVLTVAVYYVAFRLSGHASFSELRLWIRESSHGWHQTANAVRFIFGFPRSFLDMGNDGVLFKRFLWHDPYAQVSIWELVRGSLLKLALFYAALAYIVFRLAADRAGRVVLIIVAAALVPLLFFAVVLFEPGSPERYLPLFPFVAMAVAFALSRPGHRGAQIAFAMFLIVSAAEMVWSRSVWEQRVWDRAHSTQLQALKSVANDHGVAWVLLPTDPLLGYAIIRPLDPVNADRPVQLQYIVETGTEDARQWREKFAKLSLRAWEQSGKVLVTNQVLAPRPERAWNWTERDIPGVRWTDFPGFFSRLERRPATSGGDGFFEVVPTAGNRTILQELAALKLRAG